MSTDGKRSDNTLPAHLKNDNAQNSFLSVLYSFFIALGSNTISNVKSILKGLKLFYELVLKRYEKRVVVNVKRGFRKLKRGVTKLFAQLVHPFTKLKDGYNVLKNITLETKGMSFSQRLRFFFDSFFDGIKNNKTLFRRVMNYLLPILGVVVLITVVYNTVTTTTYAVNVSYNDEIIGYVKNESVVDVAAQIVQSRLVYLDDSEQVTIQPTYNVEVMDEDECMDEYQLADAIISLSGDDMLEAEGLYVDGNFYGALSDVGVIQSELDSYLDTFKSEDTVSVGFVNDVKVVPGLYLTGNIITKEEITNLIRGEVEGSVYYTVQDGDTPTGIADDYDMAYSTLKALNPDIENTDVFRAGYQVLVKNSEPFLQVQITKSIVYTEEIPYETVKTESKEYASGTSIVTQKGVNGQKEITANVTYVNGIETEREVVGSKIISAATDELITIGTAVINVTSSTGSGRISSGFIWPMSGYVSSEYGYRWGSRHAGLDIARYGGAYGAPICAAAGGTVVYATYNAGGYGKLVKIDHGNGVQTWYAHCSQLYVSAGQVVSQGQQIAAAGATGNAYGAHLHFEVRINGVAKNPRSYLP